MLNAAATTNPADLLQYINNKIVFPPQSLSPVEQDKKLNGEALEVILDVLGRPNIKSGMDAAGVWRKEFGRPFAKKVLQPVYEAMEERCAAGSTLKGKKDGKEDEAGRAVQGGDYHDERKEKKKSSTKEDAKYPLIFDFTLLAGGKGSFLTPGCALLQTALLSNIRRAFSRGSVPFLPNPFELVNEAYPALASARNFDEKCGDNGFFEPIQKKCDKIFEDAQQVEAGEDEAVHAVEDEEAVGGADQDADAKAGESAEAGGGEQGDQPAAPARPPNARPPIRPMKIDAERMLQAHGLGDKQDRLVIRCIPLEKWDPGAPRGENEIAELPVRQFRVPDDSVREFLG